MKKKTKPSYIVFAILFFIFLIALVVVVLLKTKAVTDKANKVSTTYETIMNFDYVNNYPTTPDKVMDDYCYIIAYLYSEDIKDSEITDVVAKSRELLHFRTIEGTSLDAQVMAVKQERATIKGTNSYVTNITHSSVAIDSQYPNYADCSITQYTKSGNNLLGDYVLQMDEYNWKVYSWTLKGTSTQDAK